MSPLLHHSHSWINSSGPTWDGESEFSLDFDGSSVSAEAPGCFGGPQPVGAALQRHAAAGEWHINNAMVWIKGRSDTFIIKHSSNNDFLCSHRLYQ